MWVFASILGIAALATFATIFVCVKEMQRADDREEVFVDKNAAPPEIPDFMPFH